MGRDPEELAGQANRTRDLTTAGLVGECPAEDSFTALGRLDAKQRQLEALRKGIDAIQPVLSKFEDSLNDSQRTRLAIAVTG